MKRTLSFCLTLFFFTSVSAQEYTSSSIFAHNDYVQPVPFYTAYSQQVGYMEADIFLQGEELYVAHTQQEIAKDQTLEEMYFKPLQEHVSKNKGLVYANPEKKLMLMIDIKTEGSSTLKTLVEKLKKYPQLLTCPSLQITISGNVPDPFSWNNFPGFIHFDGRPGITYTDEQLQRISMISTSFRDHSKWNGKGRLPKADKDKLVTLINNVHAKNKKIRFWASPDFSNAWIQLMNLKVDILNTDDVPGLAAFLEDLPENAIRKD